MTITAFRKHKYLSSQWAKELRTNGILQRVLSVMEENHPARFSLNGDKNEDISPTRASIELGVTRGYSQFSDRLKILAEPIHTAQDIGDTTYEKENAETNDET